MKFYINRIMILPSKIGICFGLVNGISIKAATGVLILVKFFLLRNPRSSRIMILPSNIGNCVGLVNGVSIEA